MAGATSATGRPKARATPTWAAATPRCSSTCCDGKGFAQPNPRPMFPNPPGLLRLEPYSEGLRERIWWGAGSNATAVWAAKLGMNLQSSTLKSDETGEPFHVQQAAQIRAFREAWAEAGHTREPRVSVSRSIFALVNDLDRTYFGRGRRGRGPDRLPRRDDAGDLRPQLRRRAGCADRATAAGRGDRRSRHLAADRPQPARRRLQRPRDRGDPDPRRAGARLALRRLGDHKLLEDAMAYKMLINGKLPSRRRRRR